MITNSPSFPIHCTANPEVQSSLDLSRERWRVLRQETRSERQRLEQLLQLWREYQTSMDELVNWLMDILSLMRNDDVMDDSLDAVEMQLENLRVTQTVFSCVLEYNALLIFGILFL